MSALPDFTPVPRKVQRHDGWTPERQRAFIEALADTGCVAIAARMVNMSQPSVYQLRRQPGAESFRAAMDAAQTLGLQVVKDEAFDRAMNGQVIPVFVGGKLMGFRRKKNDRLLMFILRHYGQDASGRRTTINYFSTRATAGAGVAADPSAVALAKAEASTTTVKTVITGDNAPSQLATDQSAANALNAFEGVALDPEAQAEIHRALTACAERRRALADDPENDPERCYIGAAETNGYLGELESGVEGDWLDCHPEGWQREQGEHLWENLGEGGEAERIDEVLAGMAERKAKRTPEEIAAEEAEHQAEVQRMRAARANPALPVLSEDEGPKPEPPALSEVEGDDPRLDWRNWGDGGYTPPSSETAHPEALEGPISPRTGEPLRPYKKRQPKPPFTAPDEGRKAEAVAAVKVERRALAGAEAERRRRKKGDAKA